MNDIVEKPESWFKRFTNSIWDFLHRGQIIRRVAFFWMMWLTTKMYIWGLNYIETVGDVTSDHALIVGAVLGPVSALQAAVIKFYASHPYERGHDLG